VLVAPAVGEPLAEPGARDLTAQLGLEAAAGVPRAGRHRLFEVAQLGLHVGLERAGDGSGQLHVWIPEQQKVSASLTPLPEDTRDC
jgi:hypothetical protein